MTIAAGTPAPAFRLPAKGGGARGLDDLAGAGAGAGTGEGTPVVLAFFKTSCPTCQLAVPVYGELERRFRGRATVAAVTQDPLATATRWLDERGFEGDVLDDTFGRFEASRAYGVQTVPTLVLVGPGGVVDHASEGWSRDAVNAVAARRAELTGRPPDPESTPADGLPPFKPG
jgi:peroxiredoxin